MGRIRPRCGYWIRTGSELAEQLAQDVTPYSSVVLFTSSLVLKTLARWPCVRQLALGFPETLSDKFALLPVVDEEFDKRSHQPKVSDSFPSSRADFHTTIYSKSCKGLFYPCCVHLCGPSVRLPQPVALDLPQSCCLFFSASVQFF
ncbi:hypothetical protein RRG08_040942 [Elysia crispata]|uniref:Uncharacterized protein n=1 Tax=Elysia crispata TaxID=231223 RepID=A0AAE0XRV6_9GAST|nr:hypothetical protein RRG08_040942 [Elysia crispata]